MPTINSDNIQEIKAAIKDIGDKLDGFVATMPQTYVQIRHHDIQISALEKQAAENARDIAELQAWKYQSTQRAAQEHSELQKEIAADRKNVVEGLLSLKGEVSLLAQRYGTQTKILLWALGVVTSIALTVIGLYMAHVIH
jgi:hypothetical protein